LKIIAALKGLSSEVMDSRKLKNLQIRPLRVDDLVDVVELEYLAWHDYYQQYSIYSLIKDSVTREGLFASWKQFISSGGGESSRMVVGGDRRAFVALLEDKLVGVAAASSYVEGKWPVVDELLRGVDGSITKTSKFQELYISPEVRGLGVGKRLSIARADAMLKEGYRALFLTTYAAATRTNQYHLKNGLEHVHEYQSIERFKDGKRVQIACFFHPNLEQYRDDLKARI